MSNSHQIWLSLQSRYNRLSEEWERLAEQRSALFYLRIHTLIAIVVIALIGSGTTTAFQNLITADADYYAVYSLKYAEWIRPYFFPGHKFTLFGFVSAIMAASLCLLAYKFLSEPKRLSHFSITQLIIFSLLMAFNAILIFLKTLYFRTITPSDILLCWAIWFGLWMGPFFLFDFVIRTAKRQRFQMLFLLVIGAELLMIMLQMMSGQMPLTIEYFEFPTTTVVSADKSSPVRRFDTITTINERHLWGNHQLYDPRVNPGQDRPCLEGNVFHIPITERVVHFIKDNQSTFYVPNNQSDQLCFTGALSNQDKQSLLDIVGSEYHSHINAVSLKNRSVFYDFNHEKPSKENSAFLRANKIPIIQTIHDLELILHHHFQILNPIHNYAMDRPLKEIITTYGGSFLLVHFVMNAFGGIDYGHFLQVIFGSYIAYIGLFLLCTHILLRDLRLTLFVAAVLIGSVKGLGAINLFAGVGYAPIRHFLDLAVLMSLATYLRRQKPLWLLVTAGFALMGLGLDQMMGLFPVVAFLAFLFTRSLLGIGLNRRWEIAALIATAALATVVMISLGKLFAPNPFTIMFFDGVWGFPISVHVIAIVILIYGLALMFVLNGLDRHDQSIHFSLSLYLIYVTCLGLFYWLMVPNYGHRNAVLPMAALAVGMIVTCPSNNGFFPKAFDRLALTLMVVGIMTWFGMSLSYWREKRDYDAYAASHQIYEWTFPRMAIRSTADPAILQDAVTVLEGYSKPKSGIHILSQHDALLTLLSDRYSLMPYFEVGMFLNGPGQQEIIVEALKRDKPKFLFVDSCITCAIPPNFPTPRNLLDFPNAYYARTKQKINRLQQMPEVFAQISSDYRLVKTGHLISVYERIE